MKGKIANWNASQPSLAGRITLAQAVLGTMPLYAMQTANIPIGTCAAMEKSIRGFVWGHKDGNQRLCKVAWNKVIRPKEEGGLGLRDLHLVNVAFGMKACWGLFTKPNSLWKKFLCTKYKFDPPSGFDPVAPSICTPFWRLVCKSWKEMWKNIVWDLGTGERVQFWNHRWVPNLEAPLSNFVIKQIPDNLLYKTVNCFVEGSGWSWSKFQHLLPGYIVELIATIIPPNELQGEDEVFWGLSSTGKFSLKTSYDKLVGRDQVDTFIPWNRVWNWYGPQRIKTFFWLLLNDGILVNEERARRCMSSNDVCGVCGRYSESRLHMLRDCMDARRTWTSLLKYGNIDWFFDSTLGVSDWVVRNVSSKLMLGSGTRWCTIFGVGCWLIWKKRCGFVLQGERMSPEGIIAQIITMARNIDDVRLDAAAGAEKIRPSTLVGWRPPLPPCLKLNTDASLERGTGRAFGGGLFRDSAGIWKHGFVVNIGVCSILLAEIWCIFYGVQLAERLGIRTLEVESDNFVAVSMILGQFELSINCRSIVKRIRDMLSGFDFIVVRHVHREGNFAADYLSHYAYTFHRGVHVLDTSPSGISIWLLHDRLGVSYYR